MAKLMWRISMKRIGMEDAILRRKIHGLGILISAQKKSEERTFQSEMKSSQSKGSHRLRMDESLNFWTYRKSQYHGKTNARGTTWMERKGRRSPTR